MTAVKNVPKTFEDLAIKSINDTPHRHNVVYFVCGTYFEKPIKAAERNNNRGTSDRLVVRSSKMRIPSDFQKFLNNNNNKERLFEIIQKHFYLIIIRVLRGGFILQEKARVNYSQEVMVMLHSL